MAAGNQINQHQAQIKCIIQLEEYKVLVWVPVSQAGTSNNGHATDDGGGDASLTATYEQFINAIKADDQLAAYTNYEFEIYDTDAEDYVMLRKGMLISHKSKLRPRRPREMHQKASSPLDRSFPALDLLQSKENNATLQSIWTEQPILPLPYLGTGFGDGRRGSSSVKSVSSASNTSPINGSESNSEEHFFDIPENEIKTYLGHLNFDGSSDEENQSDDDRFGEGVVARGPKTNKGYASSERPDSFKAHGSQNGLVKHDLDQSSSVTNFSETLPDDIIAILKKKNPSFEQTVIKFWNERSAIIDSGGMRLEDLEKVLLRCMDDNFERIVNNSGGKTPDDWWELVAVHVRLKLEDNSLGCGGGDGAKLPCIGAMSRITGQYCREQFHRLCDFYLAVQMNSSSYKESYALFPFGFQILCNQIITKDLLKHLGFDQRKSEILDAATRGIRRATVQKMIEDYEAFKSGAISCLPYEYADITLPRAADSESQASRSRGSSISEPSLSEGQLNKRKAVQPNLAVLARDDQEESISDLSEHIPPSILNDPQYRVLPKEVQLIVARKSTAFGLFIVNLWSRPQAKKDIEDGILRYLKNNALAIKSGEFKPREIWTKVAIFVRERFTSKPEAASSPAAATQVARMVTADSCWREFNQTLDNYLEVCLAAKDEMELNMLYPITSQMLRKYIVNKTLLFWLGLDKKRVGIFNGLATGIHSNTIRKWVGEYDRMRQELGMKGYLIKETPVKVKGIAQAVE